MIQKAFTKHLKQLYPYTKVELKGMSFPIGYSYKGLISHTLDDESPHMLIGGTTGSGKSVCLRVIITNLILTKTVSEIKLHLCDLKGGVEFAIFKRSGFIQSLAKNMGEASELLMILREEMYNRLDLFEKVHAVNLDEYNKKTNANLPRHLLIIDELANITLENKDVTELLGELLRMARAVGIHIILATQRPDRDTLPGALKANISSTVCFKTRNDVNSKILIDHGGAESLRGKGHGIFQATDEIEFQGLYLSSKDAENLIKGTFISKQRPADNIGVIKRDNKTRSASA
jgi:S-DNA-T family DNA segregation ATPase FtsK/SpoIIIE